MPINGVSKNKRLAKNRPTKGDEYIAMDAMNASWNASQTHVLESNLRFFQINQQLAAKASGIRPQQ